MNHSGEGVATGLAPAVPTTRAWLFQGAVLALLVGWLYRNVLWGLGVDWYTLPDFSHGFFVPLFSGWVVWQDRQKLAAIPVRPAWFGALVIAGSMAMLIVGNLGAEFFLARASFIFLVAGLVIHFLGWAHFRALLFPWVVLFLMIPIPAILFNQITFPLQLMASKISTSLLQLLGVPVLREGNVIQLPVMNLEVAEACSGIRSLVSLTTLAVIYGYFLEKRVSRRWLMLIAAIPIAVLANALRVMGTGLVAQYWDPAKAEGFFHEFSGWVIFVLSLGMLLAFHQSLQWLDRMRTPRSSS